MTANEQKKQPVTRQWGKQYYRMHEKVEESSALTVLRWCKIKLHCKRRCSSVSVYRQLMYA